MKKYDDNWDRTDKEQQKIHLEKYKRKHEKQMDLIKNGKQKVVFFIKQEKETKKRCYLCGKQKNIKFYVYKKYNICDECEEKFRAFEKIGGIMINSSFSHDFTHEYIMIYGNFFPGNLSMFLNKIKPLFKEMIKTKEDPITKFLNESGIFSNPNEIRDILKCQRNQAISSPR